MLRAIREIRPRWVVGENVLGIVSWDGGLVFEQVHADLETEGYEVQAFVLPACGIDAPHHRYRTWFVAHAIENSERYGCKVGELIQERTEVRKFGDVSAGSADGVHIQERVTSNSENYGCRTRDSEGCEIRERNVLPGEQEGREIRSEHNRCDCERTIANSDSERREECDIAGQSERAYIAGGRSDEIQDRWSNFPTQPPVRERYDGFRVSVDGITIYDEKRDRMDRNSIIWDSVKSGKIIVDFETGDIYSTTIRGREGEKVKLKGSDCNGYLVHTISLNGIKKQVRAHQVVWIAANGLYDKNLFVIDHINRDRKDNRLSNLRLVTQKENVANCERKDTHILSIEDRLRVCELFYGGNNSIREIAEDFGVSKSTVFNILHEKELDGITLPKWRSESIKAYGNAIVPQVAYRIFEAINKCEAL